MKPDSDTHEMIVKALSELVSDGIALPAVPALPGTEDLAPWRRRIDALDRIVLVLLNERSECANIIGQIKKKLGMPVYVPSREDEVIRNVFESNPGPLSNEAVRRLFERIIDETRALERQKYQERGNADDSRHSDP